MIYLFLSILCATGLFIIFKLFARFEVNNFQAIVVNYIVAFIFGLWYANSGDTAVHFKGSESWLWIAVIMGLLFIAIFQIMARTSQIHGVSITSVATKMSMVIPTLFFILFDPNEGFTIYKVLGILFGIVAVLLASARKEDTLKVTRFRLFPIILFLGCGFLDLVLAYTEKSFLASEQAYRKFVPVPFAAAAIVGVAILFVQILRKRQKFDLQSTIGGIILGFVNYGSVYFFLKILGSGVLDRSSAIPANSMGTVALSAILGFALFRERLSAKNILGIFLALIAILLLTWRGL